MRKGQTPKFKRLLDIGPEGYLSAVAMLVEDYDMHCRKAFAKARVYPDEDSDVSAVSAHPAIALAAAIAGSLEG